MVGTDHLESHRVHIVGASGTGTTTLGRALADAWSVPHADVDDYFWEPTEPPYITKRDPEERLDLMQRMFLPRSGWVLSGSLIGWGDTLIPRFDCVVFLTVEASVRLSRLRERESRRYGSQIEPGGDRELAFAEFLAWASAYDDPDFDGRSLAAHERWLTTVPCPVLRLDGAAPTRDLVSTVLGWHPPSLP